jgi:hypothetical protein
MIIYLCSCGFATDDPIGPTVARTSTPTITNDAWSGTARSRSCSPSRLESLAGSARRVEKAAGIAPAMQGRVRD